MPDTLKIGFLGAGKMATALAKGFIRAGLSTANEMIASDHVDSALVAFNKETGAKTTTSNIEVAQFANILILAVKPGNVAEAVSYTHLTLPTKRIV